MKSERSDIRIRHVKDKSMKPALFKKAFRASRRGAETGELLFEGDAE